MCECYHVSNGLLPDVVTVMRMACGGQGDVPHAGGMIAAASKNGGAVIEDAESVGLEQDGVAGIT